MQIIVGFCPTGNPTSLPGHVGGAGRASLPSDATGYRHVYVWIELDEEPMFINIRGVPWLPGFRKVPMTRPTSPPGGAIAVPRTGRLYVTFERHDSSLLSEEQISVM